MLRYVKANIPSWFGGTSNAADHDHSAPVDPDDTDQEVDFEELPTPTENTQTGRDQRSPPAETTRPSQVSVQDLLNTQEACPRSIQWMGSSDQPRPWYPEQPLLPTPKPLPTQGMSAWQTVLPPAQQHAHPSSTEIVPTLFDRMETNYPYFDLTIHKEPSRAFIQSRMPEYFETSYVSSNLWKWEAESGMKVTECMNIAMPHVPGDVWIALRLSYRILRYIGHSDPGDVTNFTWEKVQSLFGESSGLLETSQRWEVERKVQCQGTRCVWTRTRPGDDILLGFCVGEHVGRKILDQCTQVC